MTPSPSLEDTIARADYWLAQEREDDYSLEGSVTYDLVRDLTVALRAASVVPAEPASHERHGFYDHEDDDGFHYATCICGWEGPPVPDVEDAADTYGDHRATRAAVAAVDGEAPAT